MARRPFFSGNYGSALGSTANAANLIARAGATQGQAMANMGAQIGGMIQQYGLNKQKRAELTNQIESAIKFNPEYLSRMTSTGDEEADKKARNTIDKLTKGDLNMSQLKGLAGDLAMMEKVDLRKQKEEDRKIANAYQKALTLSKTNENSLFQTTKALTEENQKLTNQSKRLENVLKGVEAYIKVESLPEELQSTLRKLNEDIAEADAKEASRKAYTPTERALDEKAQAGATIDKTKQEVEANKNKNKITPLQDTEGNVVPGSFMIGSTPFTMDSRGSLARVGTPSENIGEVRTNKAEDIINMGRENAKNFDPTNKPIDPNIVGGADLGGIFEDVMLYIGGKVGLSGKQIDKPVDLGLEEREEQTARLNFLNAQIRPTLVKAVTSRGNVYTQQQIDKEILANEKESNSQVAKKLRNYPTLLENALMNAETVLRDPEIKPGTSVYEQARQIALQTPTLLKQIYASVGTLDQYDDINPDIQKIIEGSSSRNESLSDSNVSEMSDADLLKSL